MKRVLAWAFGILALALIATIVFVELRNRSGAHKAEAEFAAHEPSPIGDFGATRTLSILPLIDWHTSGPELRGEMGVSYLIETDDHPQEGNYAVAGQSAYEFLGIEPGNVPLVYLVQALLSRAFHSQEDPGKAGIRQQL